MNNEQFQGLMEQYLQQGKDLRAMYDDYIALAAAGKTPLGLNQWVKSDKPAMEDFNEDNRIIDGKLRELMDRDENLRELVDNKAVKRTANAISLIAAAGNTANGHYGAITAIKTGFFTASIDKVSGTFQSGDVLFTLPDGFQPVTSFLKPAAFAAVGTLLYTVGYIRAHTNGEVTVFSPPATANRIYLNEYFAMR